ncbi:relaxase/mobilization nuclease domain-containing protein [Gloeobacter morelensis]|uniref:Relaxase/mobilization nuclease domain-containing protein n=1 Tax=Gloeobacter morelensis MG652769 TaxID=2781736 RepID=A0ABY3PG27_9CYAN|nr:relaxase/mobilization nuclease domain-containing protein [Gloeobacter morelensis]UFP92589.1 relaxase/mobilization nuclease domain-containing protein [Gloeobacter morelensis MG652769]
MIGNVTTGKNFGGLIGYLLKKGHQCSILGGNVLGRTPKEIRQEFEQCNRLARHIGKPCMHVSLSARPGERIDRQQWLAMGRDYLRLMSIDPDKHLYLIVEHRDRPHPHVHLIISRISTDGSVYHNHWDAYKTKAAAAILTEKYGLWPVPDGRSGT